MEYVVIGIIVATIIAVGSVIWHLRLKRERPLEVSAFQKQDRPIQIEDNANQQIIQIEQLPAEAIADDQKLMEITDSKVISRVNNLAPALFQAGNTAINAVQANNQVIYQAIIPADAKLANSRDMVGAFRGIYHDADGIAGQANFIPVNSTANVIANTVATAMGVASIVVGQYYMAQINTELNEISADISKIADFQENEYRSKVFALVAQVQKAAKFQVDFLLNEELRLNEIANLNNWDQECIQLLGQANLTLTGFSKKNNLDFKDYEKELNEAQNWFIYQKTLMEIMVQIEKLKYTLHLGTVSREQCGALVPIYSKQVQDALAHLASWHQTQVEKFKINIEDCNRKRIGFDGIIHMVPGLINEDSKYRSISDNTVKKIVAQINGYDVPQKTDRTDLFQEDVKLVAKGGKIYYLPKTSTW